MPGVDMALRPDPATADKTLQELLRQLTQPNPERWVTRQELRTLSRFQEDAIDRSLNRLKKQGLIAHEHGRGYRYVTPKALRDARVPR